MLFGRTFTIWFSVIIILSMGSDIYAQTCCSGGVPISSNVGLPSAEKGLLQIALSYDLNQLNTLKSATRKLDDQSRQRSTQSILLQAGYSITERFSIDGFISYVNQKRVIRDATFNPTTETYGIGDAVILVKYKLWNYTAGELTLGIGPKLPTGRSDLKNDQGIQLLADLQPGSGALDGILWANHIHNLSIRPSLSVNSLLIVRKTGVNNNYLGSVTYQFGNEIQVISGIADQFIIGNKLIDTSLSFRYRTTSQDKFMNNEIPNTGGDFVFIRPSVGYNITPKINVSANIELPVYNYVAGTQVATTYRVNVGIHYGFPLKNKTEIDL